MPIEVTEQPTLEEVESWLENKEKITIAFRRDEETQTRTGIVDRIIVIESNKAILFFKNQYRGIPINDISSFIEMSGTKIIVDVSSSEALPISEVITLQSGGYQVLVYKHALAESCEYFQQMLTSNFKEVSQSTIDLSSLCDENELKLLLNYFEHGKRTIHTLDHAYSLLAFGDYFCSHKMIHNAFELIAKKITDLDFQQWTLNTDSIHPLLANLILTVNSVKERYQPRLNAVALLQQSTPLWLNSFDHYEEQMKKSADALKDLTGLNCFFDGIQLIFEPINKDDYTPDEKYRTKLIEILIGRKILSGECNFSTDNKKSWVCKPKDVVALLHLKKDQLRTEIEEASQLITEIVQPSLLHSVDNYLKSLTSSSDVSESVRVLYRILDNIGCIKLASYRFNDPKYKLVLDNAIVNDPHYIIEADNRNNIINFDIEKLRLLKVKGITKGELVDRYEQLLYQQINVDNLNLCPPSFEEILFKMNPDMLLQINVTYRSVTQSPGLLIKGTVGRLEYLMESSFKDINIHPVEEFENSLYSSRVNKFFCTMYTLMTQCKNASNQTVAQALIADIAALPSNTNIKIDELTKYLLEYWAFESQHIRGGLRYPHSRPVLTDPNILCVIIKRYQKNHNNIPDVQSLFNFLETSVKVEGVGSAYDKSPMPEESQLKQFAGPLVPENSTASSRHAFYPVQSDPMEGKETKHENARKTDVVSQIAAA